MEIILGVYIGTVNEQPIASEVSVTGILEVGQTLTGHYTYTDPEGDVEGDSRYRWYRADDASGTNKEIIDDANAQTYLLQNEDDGKYISFEVTPVSELGNTPGYPVESVPVGPVTLPYASDYDVYNAEGEYNTYTGDGVKRVYGGGAIKIRKRIVGNYLYYDITLTALGFDGVEGVDWRWTDRIQFQGGSIRNGVTNACFSIEHNPPTWAWIERSCGTNTYPVWREGIRGGKRVVDHALTPTAFSGTEGIDWENII